MAGRQCSWVLLLAFAVLAGASFGLIGFVFPVLQAQVLWT
jgi:hypothetical protein